MEERARHAQRRHAHAIHARTIHTHLPTRLPQRAHSSDLQNDLSDVYAFCVDVCFRYTHRHSGWKEAGRVGSGRTQMLKGAPPLSSQHSLPPHGYTTEELQEGAPSREVGKQTET